MRTLIEKYSMLLQDDTGVVKILAEMDRQTDDAKKSIVSTNKDVKALAQSIREKDSLLLLGMGASHFANELFALQLRKLGIRALAVTASEYLHDPIPRWEGPVLLTSQSGESVETVRCLDSVAGNRLFSITLNENSTIGKNTTALVAQGGQEIAFAGTRSVTLTVAIMASVCIALGMGSEELLEQSLHNGPKSLAALEKALGILSQANHVVATGRSIFAPLAQLFALGCEELGRKPMLCLETGQLRHGPAEILDGNTALVLFRQDGSLGQLATSFEALQQKAGFSFIVFDASSYAPLKGATTVKFPQGEDIFTVLGMMDAFQTLMIMYACTKNPFTGMPRYGSKVTTSE